MLARPLPVLVPFLNDFLFSSISLLPNLVFLKPALPCPVLFSQLLQRQAFTRKTMYLFRSVTTSVLLCAELSDKKNISANTKQQR